MKTRLFRFLAVAGWFFALQLARGADGPSITIALVPQKVDPGGATFTLPNNLLKANPPLSPAPPAGPTTVELQFDLQAIPAGATIKSAVLRLIPSSDKTSGQTQQIRIFGTDPFSPTPDDPTKSKGQLVYSTGFTAIESTSTATGMTQLIQDLRNKAQSPTVTLTLRTDSISTSQAYRSTVPAPVAGKQSPPPPLTINQPRLIVSWTDPADLIVRDGAQLRYRGNPDDMTPWSFDASSISGSVMTKVFGDGSFNIAGPAFAGSDILLLKSQTAGASATLMPFALNGFSAPSTAVQNSTLNPPASGTSWNYLRADISTVKDATGAPARSNLLAFATDGSACVWPLAGGGMEQPLKLSAAPGALPTVSDGGMVTFIAGDQFVHTFSPAPDLDELWQSPASTPLGFSNPAISPLFSPPHGDNLVYALGPKGFLAVDAVRGNATFPPSFPPLSFPANSTLGNLQNPGFNPPLAFAAPSGAVQHDWVFLSAYTPMDGELEGYTDFTAGTPGPKNPLQSTGLVSRPISPPNSGPIVYCVQKGSFCGYDLNGNRLVQSGSGLSASSNLVADGDGNIYFYGKTTGKSGFFGFDPKGNSLPNFPVTLSLPPGTPGLWAGPNGVFYATANNQLFAIQITRSGPITTLVKNTRYVTNGPLAIPDGTHAPADGPVILGAIGGATSLGKNFQVPAGANVTCSASGGVSFGNGFAVAQGAVFRCGIVPSQPSQ